MVEHLHMRLTPALHISQYINTGYVCKNNALACAEYKTGVLE